MLTIIRTSSRCGQAFSKLCALLLTTIFCSALYRIHNDGTRQVYRPRLRTDQAEVVDLVQPLENNENLQNVQLARQYREIFSLTTRDRKFIPIFYQGAGVTNPNIVPHPSEYNTWIIISRNALSDSTADTEEQLICTAVLTDEGTFFCNDLPEVLPVPPPIHGICKEENTILNFYFGAHSPRLLYGPEAPYLVYGSHSQYTCLGVWIQDARSVLDAFHFQRFTGPQVFLNATEVRKAGPIDPVEKNFFPFWDGQGQMYVHHSLWPRRIFAQLESDGGVGDDLAPRTTNVDQVCYAKYMPHLEAGLETIQQASNSLSVTLCHRKDAGCVPDDSNTFIVHIFHIKSENDGHAAYEPYALLFQRNDPFALHAIAQRPLWIHGRNFLNLQAKSNADRLPERFYTTSITWKSHTQKYHGYIDDVLFLSFGIEDSAPGTIDIMAGDLLQDLGFC